MDIGLKNTSSKKQDLEFVLRCVIIYFWRFFSYLSRKIQIQQVCGGRLHKLSLRLGKSSNRRVFFSRNEFRERMFHNPHHLKVSQPSAENLLDCFKEKTTFICFFLQLLGVKLSALSWLRLPLYFPCGLGLTLSHSHRLQFYILSQNAETYFLDRTISLSLHHNS